MGGQAQVVTFALDALLAQGEIIHTVLALHLAPETQRVHHALAQLSAEFSGNVYHGHNILFRHLAIHAHGKVLPAIRTASEAEAVWALGRDVLAQLKQDGQHLHLCIAGGPRLLALTLTSAAALLCDHSDKLWHLYTPPEFLEKARDGAILHAPEDAGVTLLPVPLMPWAAYLPALQTLTQPQILAAPPDDAGRCAAVYGRLSDREKDTLRALAGGLSLQEAAAQLNITLKTLDSHKTKILAECRIAWAMPESARLTYHFLREKFGGWLRSRVLG